jgi:hypothetical protein
MHTFKTYKRANAVNCDECGATVKEYCSHTQCQLIVCRSCHAAPVLRMTPFKAATLARLDRLIQERRNAPESDTHSREVYTWAIQDRDSVLSALPGQVFYVSKTYDITTPESASNGDFEESGFVYSKTPMRLGELLQELESLGYYENLQETDGSQSLYATDGYTDYSDGSETREAIHIEGPKRAMRRLYKILSRDKRR